MLGKAVRKEESQTGDTLSEKDQFYLSNGVQKRKIFYHVKYKGEEQQWIFRVRQGLKKQKQINIQEDQTLLRFYYSANFDFNLCLEKLEKYHAWFTNPQIQTVTSKAKQLFRQGFVYSYDKTKDGHPFIILNLSIIDFDQYTQDNYFQAINHTLNRAVKEDFIPGYIETYYYIIDLDQKLLSLPLTSLGNIVSVISNAYSSLLEKMMIINCTTMSKWLYHRITTFLSEQTARKIRLYTRADIQEGQLTEFIDKGVLEQKYGGLRGNVDHLNQQQVKMKEEELSETQFFSIEQNEEYVNYKQGSCCGNSQQCSIY